MQLLPRIMQILAIALLSFTFAACNTLEGVGEDLEEAGDRAEEALDDDELD